jgi:muconate cycloisomerase
METTTIQSITAHEVIVPGKKGSVDSAAMGRFADAWDELPIVLLEFRLSDGITALGEIGRGNTLASLAPWLQQLPGLALRSLDLGVLPDSFRKGYQWGLLTSHPPALYDSHSPVTYAFETMLYDWVGKKMGCRMVDLLGGPVRHRVAVDGWCGRQTPQDLLGVVERAKARGFKGIKMKSKIGDPTVAQVKAIKDAGGDDFGITIDPMWQWLSPHDALYMLKQLEPHAKNLRIEDPFPWEQPEMWQRVRQVVAIPLVLHTRTMGVLRHGLQHGYADNFNCSGYVAEFMAQAHAVEVAGYSCWHGSSLELGVGQASILHRAAAARSCTMPSDLQSAFIREHTLVTWDWPYQDGALPIPSGHGLGIELDHDAIAHYRVAQQVFG